MVIDEAYAGPPASTGPLDLRLLQIAGWPVSTFRRAEIYGDDGR